MDKSINNSKPQRLGSIEILRFIGMLMIMAHHTYILGAGENYLFELSWIWVDFFFMLTGYYTAKHFAFYQRKDNENLSKTVMVYNIKKLKGYFIICVVAILLQYVINYFVYGYGIKSTLIVLSKLPYELLFVTSSGVAQGELLPLWYLSAVFIVLPIVAYLFVRLRDFWYIFSFVVPLIYLGACGVNTSREWPNDMLRAFAYLTLGTFIYLICEWFGKLELKKFYKVCLTLVELFCVLVLIGISAINFNNNIIILLFVFCLIIMLSQQSFSIKLSSSFASMLGKLSLPMFVFHWGIGTVINCFVDNMYIKVLMYYLVTIVVAILVVYLSNKIKKARRKNA